MNYQPTLDKFLTAEKLYDLIPGLKFELPAELNQLLGQIVLVNVEKTISENGSTVNIALSVVDEVVLGIESFPDISIVLGGSTTGDLSIGIESRLEELDFVVGGEVRIRFSRNLLVPAVSQSGTWIPDESRSFTELTVGGAIRINTNGAFDSTGIELTLPASLIGSTGLAIEGKLLIDFSDTHAFPQTLALGLDETWKGVVITETSLYLPTGLDIPILPNEISFEDFHIGNDGISGGATGHWTPALSADKKSFTGNGSGSLFGIPFALSEIAIAFRQNTLTESFIEGALILPFFDQPIVCSINLTNDGDFTVSLSAAQDIPGMPNVPTEGGLFVFTKEDLIRLKLRSIAFAIHNGTFEVTLGGSVQPLFGGINWPEFQLDGLSIDSTGKVKIAGGWINMPTALTADFKGFALEISKLGFGNEDDGSKWIGFSGGISIVEGVPMRGGVEGLKIIWKAPDHIRLELKGISVAFVIEDVLSFEGKVVFIDEPPKSGFKGGVKMILYALEGLSIDAQFIAGKNDESPAYKFFYIYIGLELPVGIPLGATGISLYGFAGLFGYNMTVDKREDEAWFEGPNGEIGYYKRSPEGITDVDKWTDQRDQLAFGAGITFGTGVDNGFTVTAKVLLVVLIPGPVILIEGKVGILQERASVEQDAKLKLLAVLDFRTGTYLLNIEMMWKLPDDGMILDIHGGAEAFFTANDPNAWYFYLGRRTPVSKRIRAGILSLFEANTYFMIDANKLEIGTWIGIDKRYKFGPARLVIAFWMEGVMGVAWKPIQAWGSLTLNGEIELSIFGIGLNLMIYSSISGQVPTPWFVHAVLRIKIGMPWPIPTIEGTVELEWKEEEPPPVPTLVAKIGVEHLRVSEKWDLQVFPVYDADGNGFYDGIGSSPSEADLLDAAPLVPVDGRPVITFNKAMADNLLFGNTASPDPAPEQVDEYQFKYILKNIRLEKKPKDGLTGWVQEDTDRLHGEWLIVPDDDTTNTKFMLWATNPFESSRELYDNSDFLYATMFAKQNARADAEGKGYPCKFDTVPYSRDFVFNAFDEKTYPHLFLKRVDYDEVPHIKKDYVFFSFSLPIIVGPHGNNIGVATKTALWLDEGKGNAGKLDFADAYWDEEFKTLICNGISIYVPIPEGADVAAGLQSSQDIHHLSFDNLSDAPVVITFPAAGAQPGPCEVALSATTGNSEQVRIVVYLPDGSQELFVTPGQIRIGDNTDLWRISKLEIYAPQLQITGMTYRYATETSLTLAFREKIASLLLFFDVGADVEVLALNERQILATVAYQLNPGYVDYRPCDVNYPQGFDAVRITGSFRLVKVAYVTQEENTRAVNAAAVVNHNRTRAVVAWNSAGELLDPFHLYRVTVETEVQYRKRDDSWQSVPFAQTAYFKTSGPPGVRRPKDPPLSYLTITPAMGDAFERGRMLMAQAGVSQLNSNIVIDAANVPSNTTMTDENADTVQSDKFPYGGQLADLSVYVIHTVPVQRGSNEPARLPYRSDDLGIVFNEAYGAVGVTSIIDQMYRMADMPLTIQLLDNNDKTVTDVNGNPLQLLNTLYRSDQQITTREETQWVNYLDEYGCQYNLLPRRSKSSAAVLLLMNDPDFNLLPQTPYKARLLAGGRDEVFRFNFITSRFSNFVHHIHSYIDKLWVRHEYEEPPSLDAAATAALQTSVDTGNFSSIEELLFAGPPRNLPERMEVTLLTATDENEDLFTTGFLVESPEPFSTTAMTIVLSKGNYEDFQLPPFKGPLKLIGAATDTQPADLNEEYFDILLMEDYDLTGVSVGLDGYPLYTFGAEEKLPEGTIVRVCSGQGAPIARGDGDSFSLSEIEVRFRNAPDFAFIASVHTLVLIDDDDQELHGRSFAFNLQPDNGATIIWNDDGTRFFVFPSDDIEEGDLLQLQFILDRGNIQEMVNGELRNIPVRRLGNGGTQSTEFDFYCSEF